MILGILVGTVATILLTVIASFFIGSKEINVKESLVINKPISEVYAIVGDFKTWKSWSPWMEKDPNIVIEITGKPGRVNHFYSWSGNDEVGEGNQKIMEIKPNKYLNVKLTFTKPIQSESKVEWFFEEVEGGTKATWATQSDNDFMGRVFDVFMDFNGEISKDFKKGLKNISEL